MASDRLERFAADGRAAQRQRVVVTGSSGRIGRVVVAALVARGHAVVAVDRVAPVELLPGVEYLLADLRERKTVAALLRGAQGLCHFGEIPNLTEPYAPDEVFAHNTAVGATVLQCAAEAGLQRAIYASSAQVYGCYGYYSVPPQHLPFDETHPLNPQNAYAAGKAANEGYARLVAQRSGLPVSIFRLPATIEYDGRSVESPEWKWYPQHAGHGDGFGTYLHSDDAARACVLALETVRPGCEAYHLVAAEVLSPVPLAELLARSFPRFPPLPAGWGAYDAPLLTGKARAHFGWAPRFSLRENYRALFGGAAALAGAR